MREDNVIICTCTVAVTVTVITAHSRSTVRTQLIAVTLIAVAITAPPPSPPSLPHSHYMASPLLKQETGIRDDRFLLKLFLDTGYSTHIES